ncbi:MAG: hypothetical protein WCY05_06430, partial [Candidatus Omnitrophota bacterium]
GTQSGITVWPAEADHLTISGNSNQSSGASQTITIYVRDIYGNICSTGPNAYTEDMTLVFSGAGTANGNYPTVTNNADKAKEFGLPTTITITSGVSTSGGSMTLYKVETASVYATDGTYRSPNPFVVNVTSSGPIIPPEPAPTPRPDNPRPEDNKNNPAFYLDNFLRRKKYKPGKYRTVVVVFEGSVVTAPYDEKGVKVNEATIIRPGEKTVWVATIGTQSKDDEDKQK